MTKFDMDMHEIVKNIHEKLFYIVDKSMRNEFITICDIELLQSSYDVCDSILLFLETRYLEYQDLYNELVLLHENLSKDYDYFKLFKNKYLSLDNDYLDFIEWAAFREHLVFPYDKYYYIEAFKLAKEDYSKMYVYLNGMQDTQINYLYNLALHNIIISPDSDNQLFTKYNINLNALGMANSVSDSVSSVSISIPEWVKDVSISDSVLTQTPYGIKVLEVRTQITNLVVCP